jgi:hypothetical protein
VMTLKFHHADAPRRYRRIYWASMHTRSWNINSHKQHSDVIVHDIVRVLMFSLQAPRYTTFDGWYCSFMQKIERRKWSDKTSTIITWWRQLHKRWRRVRWNCSCRHTKS